MANGADKIGKAVQIAGALKWAIAFILAVATAWATMRITVQMNCAKLDTHAEKINALDSRTRHVEDFAVEQKVHNEWTKETLIRIEEKLDK